MKTTIAPPIDSTVGNQASRPNQSRHWFWTGPVKPITDRVTNPSTYDGIASGAISSHPNTFDPGNR